MEKVEQVKEKYRTKGRRMGQRKRLNGKEMAGQVRKCQD